MRLLMAFLLSFCLFSGAVFAADIDSGEDNQNKIQSFEQRTKPEGAVDAQSKPATKRLHPQGETGKAFAAERKKQRNSSAYTKWKRHLPFWPRKGMLLLELSLVIGIGIFLGQILEISGSMRMLSVLTLPITAIGKIRREAGPAFLMALQSGAVANSMLVVQRDQGSLDNRELYTSVYVVSALSLFAHLPTFVIPIGVAFGWEATVALFSVRFTAIAVQIVFTLLLSRLLVRRFHTSGQFVSPGGPVSVRKVRQRQDGFWISVWKRSKKTLRRLLTYLIPTFALMAGLEYFGFFKWLAETVPALFTFRFLPAESLVIIPAQALSLYNGAIAAANFIDAGQITTHQAVIVILFGSMVTAPVRTLRHAMPTYVAILGARPGMVMAISAQIIRMLFLFLCTLGLMWLWR